MSAQYEVVLLTTEISGQLFNICVWDVNSGTQLLTYKGASSAPRTLCLLQQDYIISAVHNKAILHVWSMQRKDQIQQRMVCPGPVTGLATSPNGLYCVAGIKDKLHIWQVATGSLLAIVSRHYQTVSCIQFTDDGSHFISGGEDNLVLVWPLARVLSDKTSEGLEPKYTWSKHSLPVTDIHVGCGAVMARVWSASLDHTVKMWDLASGQLLSNFIFDHPILSVTADMAEMRLFAGSSNGNIYQMNLFEKPAKTEHHVPEDGATSQLFTGHSKQVCCLAVTMDGTTLISGSKDFNVKLWDILSRQCIRTMPHKGQISNIKLIMPPRQMLSYDCEAKHIPLPLKQFKRQMSGNQTATQLPEGEVVRERYSVTTRQTEVNGLFDYKLYEECVDSVDLLAAGKKEDPKQVQKKLTEEIEHLQQINNNLYQFAARCILDKSKNET